MASGYVECCTHSMFTCTERLSSVRLFNRTAVLVPIYIDGQEIDLLISMWPPLQKVAIRTLSAR